MIIYLAVCENGKAYIGQTIKSLDARRAQHFATADRGLVTGAFQAALRKYGLDGFSWHKLHTAESREQLNTLEAYYIKLFNTVSPAGYNLEGGGKVKTVHEDTRRKISATVTGRRKTPEHKAKLAAANTGKTYSDASKLKRSMALIGRKRSQEASLLARTVHPHMKAIYLQHMVTREIRYSPSIRGACRELGLSPGHLSQVVSGRRNHTGGWSLYIPQAPQPPQG